MNSISKLVDPSLMHRPTSSSTSTSTMNKNSRQTVNGNEKDKRHADHLDPMDTSSDTNAAKKQRTDSNASSSSGTAASTHDHTTRMAAVNVADSDTDCVKHGNEKYSRYCLKHYEAMCDACLLPHIQKYQNCNQSILSIEGAIKKQMSNMKPLVNQVNACIDELHVEAQERNSRKKQNCGQLKKENQDHFMSMHRLLEERENQLLQEIDNGSEGTNVYAEMLENLTPLTSSYNQLSNNRHSASTLHKHREANISIMKSLLSSESSMKKLLGNVSSMKHTDTDTEQKSSRKVSISNQQMEEFKSMSLC
jgi:hypothetical protein